MNIYDDESGDLDIAKAGDELRATRLITGETKQRARIAEITAAALLDIAGSLRTVSLEAGAAMGIVTLPTIEPEPAPEPMRDFLVVGDLVHIRDTDRVGTVGELGFDGDGELIAIVDFDGDDAPSLTYYARQLERLIGDERPEPEPHVSTPEEDAEMIDADDVPEIFENGPGWTDPSANQEAFAEPEHVEPADLVDDIDADFDGAQHPAAESAVDVLRANEAKRKAAKKSASKKGTKK